MSVRAKFKVTRISVSEGSRAKRNPDGTQVKDECGRAAYETCEMQTIEMAPVYSPEPGSENYKFWEASPSGKLELNCVNPEACRQFNLGQEYYIDFTPANPVATA